MSLGKWFLLCAVAAMVGQSAVAEDIRIGATLPLTGDPATYGNLIRGGIELAADDLKGEGISTKLYFEDTPVSGGGVISSLNKLLQIDKVDGIAGNFSNVAMAAMGPLIEKAKIPAFHTAAADPLILDVGDFTVTTNIRIKDEAYHIAELLFEKLSLHRAAVISIQSNFGQAYRQFFIERFQALGGEIVADETFEISEPEYKTQLLKIRGSKPEAIFAACFGRFLGYTLKQAKESGIKAPFFSVYESEDSSVLTAAGQAAEGLRYFVTTSAISSPRFAEFRKRFMERYHSEPGTFGANAYDATMILARSLAVCKNDKLCALKAIYATHDYPGVSGTFTMEPDGATQKNFLLRQVKNGKFMDAKL